MSIKVITTATSIEFATPKGEFYMTVKYHALSKQYEVSVYKGTFLNEPPWAAKQMTLYLEPLETITFIHCFAGISVLEAKNAFDKVR